MDGVLVDFVGGACRVHGKANPYACGNFNGWTILDSPEFRGMSAADFWRPMGREFWAGLAWTDDGREILSIVESAFGKENICLLSSPCHTPGCMDGKLDWIKENISSYKSRFMFGNRKEFAASDRRILIDDADHNVRAFGMAGGRTVLVPRPWNDLRSIEFTTADYLRRILAASKQVNRQL